METKKKEESEKGVYQIYSIPEEQLEQLRKQVVSLFAPPDKRFGCVFVVSGKFDIITEIVRLIHYCWGNGKFKHYSYLGKNSKTIMSDLFYPDILHMSPSKIKHYLDGGVLFIDGLGKEHQSVFIYLLSKFRELSFYSCEELGILIIGVSSTDYVPGELLDLSDVIIFEPEKQEQGTAQDTVKMQGLEVSFNKTDYIVTINGKEYPFEDKKGKARRKLFKEYTLFELLYNNQHRYVKKGEIKKRLEYADSADQSVFNTKSRLGEIIKDSPYEIENQKEYVDRGGYKLVPKNR